MGSLANFLSDFTSKKKYILSIVKSLARYEEKFRGCFQTKQLSVLVNATNSLEPVVKYTYFKPWSHYGFKRTLILLQVAWMPKASIIESYIIVCSWPVLNRDVLVLLNFKTDMLSR